MLTVPCDPFFLFYEVYTVREEGKKKDTFFCERNPRNLRGHKAALPFRDPRVPVFPLLHPLLLQKDLLRIRASI